LIAVQVVLPRASLVYPRVSTRSLRVIPDPFVAGVENAPLNNDKKLKTDTAVRRLDFITIIFARILLLDRVAW
jgi:hypothetical protein